MSKPDRRSLANAIRALAMDAVQAANSGHPGMPMGMADIAEVLWNDYVRHNPSNPDWWDRDRVVFSNGHGSMLPYSVLHLTGYDLPLDELRNFRQWESATPGHPEYGDTPGIETTTGPLGQGLANAVGMALAEQQLARQFNRNGFEVIDHYTYCLLGDGCLMEGISHEVCSLAGTWGLGKLICLYDDNGISIDGETRGWFTDDTARRFESYGWQVISSVDGHDPEAVSEAIADARAHADRPTLICAKTVIGWGSPSKQGTSATHGAPLGGDEIAATRKAIGWAHEPFHVPEDIRDGWDARDVGRAAETSWNQLMDDYRDAHPDLANELRRRMRGNLPKGFSDRGLATARQFQADAKTVATRKASQMALEAFAPDLPELIGGSADLAGSNNTIWSGSRDICDEGGAAGNYIYFGVREFGMTAICNGLGLHGGFLPYNATFLVFSDYARNAVRMSALIPAKNIHVYTHDSIGLGEDGPTHQPVEHLASLRLIPGLDVWRPCDTVESAVAWHGAIEREGKPSVLVFSRQNLAHQERTDQQVEDIARGGYVLISEPDDLDVIIMATGSEVALAADAVRQLHGQGIGARLVSVPCAEVFDAQDDQWRESVMPTACRARVAVEAASSDWWYRYVGLDGKVIGMNRFGASAPAEKLFEAFGFTVENIVDAALSVVR